MNNVFKWRKEGYFSVCKHGRDVKSIAKEILIFKTLVQECTPLAESYSFVMNEISLITRLKMFEIADQERSYTAETRSTCKE